MNAIEIEQAITLLAEQAFNAAEFPYAFLEAFGNKSTTLNRLRKGDTNKTDIQGAVLQHNNIHMATCPVGEVSNALNALRQSPKTSSAKAKFILATDGDEFQAEDINGGETLACAYQDFPNYFGFFLPLAGISTVKQIRESAFDIRATSRLNRLYIELLKDNPDWGKVERRSEMNHFMARLIFCFFAEDTDIFNGKGLFTATIEQMSDKDASNTHTVISEIFYAMNTPIAQRSAPRRSDGRSDFSPTDSPTNTLRPWADQFPYVNGGLFSGSTEAPRFSKIARTYLLNVGHLEWQKINPDIFGSMIQAVAEDDERGALGMHYTSVPNILKVLNPLFLDDLRAKLTEARDNPRKLLNLRRRIARIRVFDPACGSGNFLVIAYKEMRAIEYAINQQRGEDDRKSDIPLTNFRGIELKNFPAEIARLALIIAEYQSDVAYRGQKEALADFLPLDSQNWITCGNALRIDWLSVCPPTGTGVKIQHDDLFGFPTPVGLQPDLQNQRYATSAVGVNSDLQNEQGRSGFSPTEPNAVSDGSGFGPTPEEPAEIDFQNEGGETYICGNPPYKGSKWQSAEQKDDLKAVFGNHVKNWKSLDYVAGWFWKAAEYGTKTNASCALVSTNSICQGHQVPILWPAILKTGNHIIFAHTSFKWANLASHNAGVTVVIVCISTDHTIPKKIYIHDNSSQLVKETNNINPYLIAGENTIVEATSSPLNKTLNVMQFGNHPYYGAPLIFSTAEAQKICSDTPKVAQFIRPIYGSKEFISNSPRACMWVNTENASEALKNEALQHKAKLTALDRQAAKQDSTAQKLAETPYRFRDMWEAKQHTIIVPGVSSENREYLPCGLLDRNAIISNTAFALYDAPLWNMAIIASKLHLVWVSSVCVRMRTDYRYSNTLGWNTFPVPILTEKNKADLTECAENILLAREMHFPATIADLYDPQAMPDNLRAAHARNDEVIERIYIGRLFKNDTERLEKLFALYTEMTARNKKR